MITDRFWERLTVLGYVHTAEPTRLQQDSSHTDGPGNASESKQTDMINAKFVGRGVGDGKAGVG